MDEKTILITEHNGTYQLQNNGISEFALIGILECILFDLKSASRQTSDAERKGSLAEPDKKNTNPIENQINSSAPLSEFEETNEPETEMSETAVESTPVAVSREATQSSVSPDLRIRIGNAIKAIRGLGAQIEDTDLSDLTEEELQSELEELTSQYKRLKRSKGAKK